MDIEILSSESWKAARLSHQAEWSALSSLQQAEFKEHAQEVIDGKEPEAGDSNFARFEQKVKELLPIFLPPQVVEELIKEVAEEEVEDEPVKKKATKKVAEKPVAKKK